MTMNYKSITLKRNKDNSLKRFHPWIFSGAIARMDKGISDGDTVNIFNCEGNYIATGHYGLGSIAVRVLTFSGEEIDSSFWRKKIGEASALRKITVNNKNTDMFRLVHGEGDCLPGLVVDVYGHTAVMQAHSTGMHRSRYEIAQAIVDVMNGQINSVYYKSNTTLPFAEENDNIDGFLIGKVSTNVSSENGLKFHIDWEHGQKTGFFVDQRENRRLAMQYAKNRKVLNMFCYTGGFSVYTLSGEAEIVHSVDSSAKAIEITDSNIELNFPECSRHKSFTEDAFRFLQNMEKDFYDFIILDPPAFAKHLDAVRSALRGYTRINQKAIEKIAKGGILFTFSCSQAVNKEQFRLAVFTAAAQAGRNVKILHQLHQSPDHPINIYHPEGEYLKGLVLYVE
jgi:23S rRNA (cytosine1962-C5)-methyltransferase